MQSRIDTLQKGKSKAKMQSRLNQAMSNYGIIGEIQQSRDEARQGRLQDREHVSSEADRVIEGMDRKFSYLFKELGVEEPSTLTTAEVAVGSASSSTSGVPGKLSLTPAEEAEAQSFWENADNNSTAPQLSCT